MLGELVHLHMLFRVEQLADVSFVLEYARSASSRLLRRSLGCWCSSSTALLSVYGEEIIAVLMFRLRNLECEARGAAMEDRSLESKGSKQASLQFGSTSSSLSRNLG